MSPSDRRPIPVNADQHPGAPAAKAPGATTAPDQAARGTSVTRAVLVEMRPRQWTKNLVILAPVLFSLSLGRPLEALEAVVAVGLFCLICGGVYIINDLHDLRCDRLNEFRRLRPLAAGELSPGLAAASAALLLAVGLAGTVLLDPWLGLLAFAYILLQAAYTFYLKSKVLLDVMAIAAGFVLRVTAGAVVVHVPVSPWLLTCTAFLALFLGLAKRRHELLMTPEDTEHRPVLGLYTSEFLDQVIAVVIAATIAMYSIYTFLSQSAADRPYLMLTIPFVVYGLLRYLYLMHDRHQGGSPEEVLLSDAPLALDLGLWTAVVIAVLYAT
jgi:4-hydroxybenzoate polyprenyltransferase